MQITRISEAEVQRFEARRLPSAGARASSLAEPSAPAQPTLAPTPAYALLDLCRRCRALKTTSGPCLRRARRHGLARMSFILGLAIRGSRAAPRTTQAAIMGELVWALYPGPVDRWDDGNVVRIKLYNGALASVTKDALLDGANVFAIESEANEWEIVQARTCVLVAPNQYQLSGFLRGQQGSAHAMRSPAPVGARIVKLDPALARASIAAHEWRDDLRLAAPPAGGNENDARTARASVTLPHAWARPRAPAHLRAKREASDDVAISWIRCARLGGDFWGPGEPPLSEPTETYRLEIWDGVVLKRSLDLAAPAYLYSAALQTADFGGLPGAIGLRVGQIGADGLPGLMTEMTISL